MAPMGMAPVEPVAVGTVTPLFGAGEDGGEGSRRLANVVQLSEARAIMDALDACGGNRVAAARQLGISERTLRYRLAAFREAGIPVGNTRGANAAQLLGRLQGSRFAGSRA